MMHHFLAALAFGLLAIGSHAQAVASVGAPPVEQPGIAVEPLDEGPLVEASLLVDHAAVAPGQVFWVAVAFDIRSDWHIYWPGHNDSGMAPLFDWRLPEGWKIGQPRWPAPTPYISEGGLVDLVLEDTPIVLFPVKVPDTWTGSARPTIACDIEWLVCKTMCIAESQRVQYSFEATNQIEPGARLRPLDAAVIKKARRLTPVPLHESNRRINVSIIGGDRETLEIGVINAKSVVFYASEEGRPTTGHTLTRASKDNLLHTVPLGGDQETPIIGSLVVQGTDDTTQVIAIEIPLRSEKERDGFSHTKSDPKP